MKRILITGGLGFVGSHIVDACVSRGDQVFSVDDLSTGRKENGNTAVRNFEVDVADADALEKVFEEARPEIIFHCAALAALQPSFERPDRYFEVNVGGTKNVLTLAKKYGTKRVVYSASSSAYGEHDAALEESLPLPSRALNPYASTKRMGEMLMRDMGKMTGGAETVCLRYFNVYGPRQSIGGAYPLVIAIFLKQRKEGKPLTVVPDGHQRRDFVWVGDVARANLLAAESAHVGGGEIINIGSGENFSIWDVARLVLGAPKDAAPEELLRSGLCELAAPRRGEARKTRADISLAKELLGWEPQMAFPEGIAELKRLQS